jgi:dTDP-4-amino-4,6-dideoxygalactose transaminase
VRIDGLSRADVQAEMLRHGISTFIFGENPHGSLPKEKYPQALELSSKILCLPIHQDLKRKDMVIILETIKSIKISEDYVNN